MMCSRRIVLTVFAARMKDKKLPNCATFGELMGSMLRAEAGKRVDGVSPG